MRHVLTTLAFGLSAIGSSATAQTTPTPTPAPQPAPPSTGFLPRPPAAGFGNTRPFAPLSNRAFANSRYYIELYEQVLSYGRCAASISPRRSARYLDARPNTPTERVAGSQLRGISRGCLPYGYRAPTIFLRAGLAEALYKARDTTSQTALMPRNVDAFLTDESDRDRTRLLDDRVFTRIAGCMVTHAPDAVRDMLYARPGSRDERTALDAVVLRSPSCTDGGRLGASSATPFIRAYLAETAYRLTSPAVGRVAL